MFKIEQLILVHGIDKQVYEFANSVFVYGPNTVGKTAMVNLLDFALGRTETLSYQGLDNIDAVEMYLTNEKTTLWVRRTIDNEFLYKRTLESQYTAITEETYKTNICNMMNATIDRHMLDVYRKVYDENPTYRTFSFINFLDEKGVGDLTTIFTRAKDMKHFFRIKNIMDFIFNYENIEKIYEKQLELEEISKELSKIGTDYSVYMSHKNKIVKIFRKLDLKYTDDIVEDKKIYLDFKTSFNRNPKGISKDLIYLTKSSFELAEEIKLFSYIDNQTNNSMSRNQRIDNLLSLFMMVIEDNLEYEKYIQVIKEQLEKIKEEQIIFSLTDYATSLSNLKEEKKKIDDQINAFESKASQLDYEEVEKQLYILENCFEIIEENIDIDKKAMLENTQKKLKSEIKELKNSYDRKNVQYFNKLLNSIYMDNDMEIKHLNEDKMLKDFEIEMDPFRLVIFTKRKNAEGVTEIYDPGSLARQTHIQIVVYLGILKYLKEKFKGLIYMPLLIIDSADQVMTFEAAKLLYANISEFAIELGIQTFFMSKQNLVDVKNSNCIDISNGLNRFHKTDR